MLSHKTTKFWLTIIVLLTFCKGLLWLFMVPIFQAPDEPQHYSYVQYLAEKKSFPYSKILYFEPSVRLKTQMEVLEVEQIAHNQHIQHSYYRSASSISPYSALQSEDVAKLDPTPSEYNYIHNYGPVYYALNLPIYLLFDPNLALQVYGMRLLSILMSCVTLMFAFLTFSQFKEFDKKWSALGALFIGFIPQFSFISSSVNNDNLIILLFSAFFYLSVKWFTQALTLKKILVLLLITVLAIATKTQGIILLIINLLYLLMHPERKMIAKLSIYKRFGISLGFVAAMGIAAIIFFEQILKQFSNYYDKFGEYFMQHNIVWFIQTITFTRLLRTYKSFWGRFGWLDTLMPQWAYIVCFALMLIALYGIFVFIFRYVKKYRAKSSGIITLKILLYLLLSIVITDFTYTILFAKNAILYDYYNFPTQGRYYFVTLIPIGIKIFWGFKFAMQNKYSNYVAICCVYLMAVLNILSVLAIIPVRYYL